MRPPDSYDAFALVYDRGLGQLFFDGVKPVLDRLEREYPSSRKRHLDIGCGTGLALRYFRERGYESIGLDASLAMLDQARRRGDQVVAGDFRDFALRSSFERITCLYDSLNHVMDEDDLSRIFAAVRQVMRTSSLFWFDLNHPLAYEAVWSISEPYKAGGPDWSLSIDTRYDVKRNLAIARVTGSCVVGGEGVEIDESHQQRAWSHDDVVRLLSGAGLTLLDCFRFNPFSFGGDSDTTVKLMYVVRLAPASGREARVADSS